MKITSLVLLVGLPVFLPPIEEVVAAPKPDCDETVVGQASSPDDVLALDAVINGVYESPVVTICLEGTFDFGESDNLLIDPEPSVEELNIIGTGPQKLTILGGMQPLTFPGSSALPRLRIQNLRFVEPMLAAIAIFGGNELVEISQIDVAGVRTFSIPLFPEMSIRYGILINSAATDEISGEVIIRDNLVDGGAYDPLIDMHSEVNTGIGVFGPFGVFEGVLSAEVKISGNTVENWSGSAISAISLSNAEFAHNKIEPGTFANEVSGCASPKGFGATAGISLVGVSDSVIRSNTITLEPALLGDGSMPDCTAAIILLGDTVSAEGVPVVSEGSLDNEFKGNEVLGTGSYAIVVGTEISMEEERNIFHDNQILKFAPTEASLFLGEGANNNAFKGNFPTLQGNIAGNSITGYK